MAKFTKEDAKAMAILDVAQSLGMELKQNSSQEWYWVEHDSFKINTRKNRFNWYSRDIHGDVIDLVKTIKEVDYKQAMHYLRTGEFPQAKMSHPVKEPFNYVLGRFEQPFVEARAYLKEVRGLSDDTINSFGQAGVLAQANKKASDDYLEPVVVFKSLDKDKRVIGASLQGIVPNKERYEGKGYLKQIAYNSDGLSGMSVDIGTPRRLVFAEAPIDLMSYYEANKGNLSDVRLVAMDGLKAGTVSRYTMELLAELQGKADYKPDLSKVGEALEKLAKVTTFFQNGKNSDLITLAVDNDKAGRDFIERLQAKGIPVQTDIPPLPEGITKMDWNDYLKSQKADMVLEDSLPCDNSRLAQAERKLERLNGELVEKADKVYAHTRQANGQPMNDKRGGLSFFRKQDKLEGSVFTKLDEIKKQEERVEKLRYQQELKERGFNKQGNGLVMSVDNIPRIKGAIEAFEKGEPGFTRATINRYRKELVKLEAMKERLEDIRISPGAQHLIDEGLVTQWQKQPTLYFVKGLRKVAFELTDSGEFQVSAKYQPKTSEEVDKVEELLSGGRNLIDLSIGKELPSNIQANEKVQELLGQVEELGQTAYFWVTEEDLGQPEEIVSQLDNWFSSEKVDATYKSDLFELVAGDYTYMIEFRDGSISLQNMEDYSQYISNRIEEFGVSVVISELESVIHDFNQVKNSITEGMHKELDALTSALTRDTERLDKQTTINNEKEQNMAIEHESETMVRTIEPRFELEASELGRPEQPITNFDELQTWMLQQFNSVFVREGYFKTYLQVYSLDEHGQEVASQIRFDVGHGQSDFNPRREHIRDYLVEHGYIQLQNVALETKATLDSPINLYMVRFNWSENLGGSPNPLKDFSEGELIPYNEFISVLYRRNEYSSDRGYERTSFDIITPDGEVLVSDFRYDTGSEVRTIAEKLEDSELAKIEEANKEPYKLLAAIDKHLEIPAHFSLPESAIDAISTQYGENTPVLSEAEEKMLDWLEQNYPPTSEYALELQRGFGVAGLKSTLNHNTWEQYVSNSPLSEAELTEEVEQRTERLVQARNEIKERLQSEFVPALLQEIQKAPEQTQEQTKKSLEVKQGTNTGGELLNRNSSFLGEDSPRSAPQPVVNESQPNFPTNVQLHFTTEMGDMSNKAFRKNLRTLNLYADDLRHSAQWYLDNVAGSTVRYIYKTHQSDSLQILNVRFEKRNWMHLTGIIPVYEERVESLSEQFIDDVVRGSGHFKDLKFALGATDKIKVIKLLSEIIEPEAFVFNDLSSVAKYNNLNLLQALNPDDTDLLLLFKEEGAQHVPASVMKIKGEMNNHLLDVEKGTVLGIYRERDGVIDQLSINQEYIRDGGKEFLTILQNRQLEPVITQEEPSLQERFTSVLDGVKELGFDLFKERNEEEFKLFHQLYEQNHNDLNQTVMAALKQDLVDINSNFFAEWKDDFLNQEKGISSVDVLNGKLTKEEYETQVSALIEEKSQPQQSLAELLESKDSQALFNHLKEGMKEYANSDKYKQFLQAISKFHDYSIYNIHMMLLQKPDISLVASYQKWKTDFDRQVQKGEKGIKIWVPMTFKEKDKNGQPVLDANGQEKTITRFKLGTVFDVSQTAGKEIPKPVYNLENGVTNYQDIYRAARHVSQENGVKISFQPIGSGANGYYHIEKKEIVIADKKMSEAQILKTLFHEMAHSELHHLDDGFNSSERELQAESIAYVVANHFGIDTSEYSFAYLHNWSLDKQGYEDLENQLKVVQAESKSLINRIDKSLELVKNKSLTNNKLQSKIAQVKQKQEQEKQLRSSEVKQETSKKQQPTPKEL
ncbi:toprim domain-containing protein [Streptococcus suis]|nr:toprim domain-containing protein [Streptococcus suis]